jgi:uncharacterized protein
MSRDSRFLQDELRSLPKTTRPSHFTGALMSETPRTEAAALIAPMIRKSLWVVVSKAVVPSAQMEPHAPEHLRYMNGLEEQGRLWASGPFVQPGVLVGDGLTIFNVPDEADARSLMDAEPLTKRGMRTYTIHRWELREGQIPIRLLCSRSAFAFA